MIPIATPLESIAVRSGGNTDLRDTFRRRGEIKEGPARPVIRLALKVSLLAAKRSPNDGAVVVPQDTRTPTALPSASEKFTIGRQVRIRRARSVSMRRSHRLGDVEVPTANLGGRHSSSAVPAARGTRRHVLRGPYFAIQNSVSAVPRPDLQQAESSAPTRTAHHEANAGQQAELDGSRCEAHGVRQRNDSACRDLGRLATRRGPVIMRVTSDASRQANLLTQSFAQSRTEHTSQIDANPNRPRTTYRSATATAADVAGTTWPQPNRASGASLASFERSSDSAASSAPRPAATGATENDIDMANTLPRQARDARITGTPRRGHVDIELPK